MAFHFVVRFDPPPARAAEFRDALLRVAPPTRAEAGCLRYEAFESIREPRAFAIHSEWRDEAAFEAHSRMPHTVRFVTAAERLLGGPVEGLRGREIGGGTARECGQITAGQDRSAVVGQERLWYNLRSLKQHAEPGGLPGIRRHHGV